MDPASESPLQRIQYYKPLDASRNELTLEQGSLDDFRPEYTTFYTKRPTQWSRSQVDDA